MGATRSLSALMEVNDNCYTCCFVILIFECIITLYEVSTMFVETRAEKENLLEGMRKPDFYPG